MNSAEDQSTIRKPVIQHVHELQKRLTWSVLAVVAGAVAAYSVNGWLLHAIQHPLGQTLYYTSPMGGFNFLLKLCLAFGFISALPVILYNIFAFLGPLLKKHHKLLIVSYTLWSFNLACAGVLFAYFVSLPSALHFLSQFGGQSIQSLITVDEYFNFALAYLAGFALIFQVPLLILFINRIKPLKPSKMMKAQRFIILFSFIGAAILTPTPDPLNQTIMALPAVLLYQVGIILVWANNRSKAKRRVTRPSVSTPAYTSIEEVVTDIVETVVEPIDSITHAARSLANTNPEPPVIRRRMSRRSIDGILPQANSM